MINSMRRCRRIANVLLVLSAILLVGVVVFKAL